MENEKAEIKGMQALIDIVQSVKETAVIRFDEDAITTIMALDYALTDMSTNISDTQKDIFVRRFIKQQTIQEIADDRQMSVSTVHYHITYAMKKLLFALSK